MEIKDVFKSAIYEGWVSHKRLQPKVHYFRYKVFMMYLDLTEIDALFSQSCLWSCERRNLVSFFRKDYLGEPCVPLDSAVRDCVEEKTGIRPVGHIRMLTNLRYFGYINNPITTYYCFDEQENLQFIVAEVTNTPWNKRHQYVISCQPGRNKSKSSFAKDHHVSPFMPMDMEYVWNSSLPAKNLTLSLQSYQHGEKQFIASLSLQRKVISPASLRAIIHKYPLMTWKVIYAIYWQALKLWLKKVPFYSHPRKIQKQSSTVNRDLKQKTDKPVKVKGAGI